MSLILDALRKSEAERRRGQSPDLFATPVVPGALPRPTWLRYWPVPIIALLLLAALFMFRQEPSAEPDVEDAGQRSNDAMAAPSAPATDSPAQSSDAASDSHDSPAVRQPALAPTPPFAHGTPVRPVVASAPIDPAAQRSAAIVVRTESTDSADETLPPISVLGSADRAALPALKLSMHVFADEPGKRFAIIDGQRVSEGATIGPAVVVAIRRDGVVLDINGRRVLLPRP